MIDLRMFNTFWIGLFGGKQPNWLYSGSIYNNVSKLGGYAVYRTDRRSDRQIEQAVGFVREFHGGLISRTFIISTGSVRFGKLWGANHSAEMDLNEGWRRERAGYTYTLSRLFLRGYLQLTNSLRASLSYNKRKNFWTYQYQTIPDSLFDHRIHQGIRAKLDYSMFRNIWLSGGIGNRSRSGVGGETFSYTGSIRVSRLFNTGISIGSQLSGFNGSYEHGLTYNIRTDLNIVKFGMVSAAFGKYIYSVSGLEGDRSSQSMELGLFKDFRRSYYIGSTVHIDSGDDIDGVRLQMELGYRY
jgi:hypothetical protein